MVQSLGMTTPTVPARRTRKVPKVMSTQHPDNAFMPSFARSGGVISGEDEIVEADYVYSTLGCDEQMWDYEGKAADVDVVLKLLLRHSDFYRERQLGRDIFLTLRIPNPTVEREMGKKVEEALHSITSSYDVARGFYDRSTMPPPPIFEVILPFTTTAEEVLWVFQYYREVVVGKQHQELSRGKRVRDWLGESLPDSIEVIPLIEDMGTFMRLNHLIESYLAQLAQLGQEASYLRVFLARSDPALNYGLIAATLLNKLALQRLHGLEIKLGIPIYPIIGVGAVPFRGNFRPGYVDQVLAEYPSVHTFTVQSSFKYDHPPATVRREIARLLARERGKPTPLDETQAVAVIRRYTARYQAHVDRLAPLINAIASHVPQRRDRRLHIGLFGYSRPMAGASSKKVIALPRAIAFCAALYSIGIPPEILDMATLRPEDLPFLRETYPHFEEDVAAACKYANEETIRRVLGPRTHGLLKPYMGDTDREHRGITSLIYDRVSQGLDSERTRRLVEWAAETRGFLG